MQRYESAGVSDDQDPAFGDQELIGVHRAGVYGREDLAVDLDVGVHAAVDGGGVALARDDLVIGFFARLEEGLPTEAVLLGPEPWALRRPRGVGPHGSRFPGGGA